MTGCSSTLRASRALIASSLQIRWPGVLRFANSASFLYSGDLLDIKSDKSPDYEAFFLNPFILIIKEVMMKTIITLLALVAFAGTAVAAEPQSNAPAAKPAAASKFPNKGKVLEVIDTSMYTYMQVSSDNGPIWLAGSKTTVAKGANIAYPNGAVMKDFHSKSLNRTFDTIIFLDKVEVLKK